MILSNLIRSVLFVPGNQPERIDKAVQTEADVIIMDLEDAVPLKEKQTAQAIVRAKINTHQHRRLWVRINNPASDLFIQDIAAVISEALDGIMVPKIDSRRQMQKCWQVLDEQAHKAGVDVSKIALIPLVETALGVQNVYDLTSAVIDCTNLLTVAFGAADFTADMGIDMTVSGAELNYPRARIAVACRAAGIQPPLDSPFMINIKDGEALRRDAERAHQLGFQGKLCVHPTQVPLVNEVFEPTSEEIQFAEKVIKAFDQATATGQGVVQVEGRLVDPPIVERARQICRWAEHTKA